MNNPYQAPTYAPRLPKQESTDLFDVVIAYCIVLTPIFGFILRKGAGMNVQFFFNFVFFVGSVFIMIRGYKKQRVYFPYYLLFYLLFTLYTILVNLLYTDMVAEQGLIKYLYSNPFITSFVGLFVAENINLNIPWLRRMLKVMTAVVLFAGFTSIVQFFEPTFLVNTTNMEALEESIAQYGDRKWSIYSWTKYVDIGFSFLSYISIIFSVGMLFGKRQYWMVFLGFLVSLLNGSRWVMLNAILISLQDFLATKNRFSQFLKYSGYLFVLLILVYFSLIGIGVDLNKLIFDRIFEESAGTRLVAWEVFQDQFPKNPILGTGGIYTQETINLIAGRSSQIHVGYLALFYLYGIIGGVLYLGFIISVLRKTFSVGKTTGFWGTYYSFLGLALANVTLVTFAAFYHGLLMGIIFHKFFEKNYRTFQKAPPQKARKVPEKIKNFG